MQKKHVWNQAELTAIHTAFDAHYDDENVKSAPRARGTEPCAPGLADLDGAPSSEYDADSDASTECVSCDVGFFSSQGSSACFACQPDFHDTDLDPATACVNDEALCPAGHYWSDYFCTACAPGLADLDGAPSTPCVACTPGTYSGLAATACVDCVLGTEDADQDPSTPCTACAVGKFGGRRGCTNCPHGTIDHDRDPATPCVQVCSEGSGQ